MLARSGRLPTGGDFAHEVKWDGFRAIVSTEGPLRVRSRRGWDMTEHVLLLAQLPVRAVLDGELVALDAAAVESTLARHEWSPYCDKKKPQRAIETLRAAAENETER
jgi:ATP-dependent DNA ligase